MLETEVKFAAHASFRIPAFEEDPFVATVEKLPDQDLKATYYDTVDLRLARSGITLRHRTGEGDASGWHLKLPVDDGRTRNELHFSGGARVVPAEVIDLVTAYVRREKVVAVETMQTRRRRWLLIGGDERPLAELSDDEVSVVQRGRVVTRFRELELEKRDAKKAAFGSLISTLKEAGASESEPIPKVVRALGPRATAPSDLPVSQAFARDSTGADLVRGSLTRGLERLVHNDPRMRQGEVEGVHQMRVAARRMRSDLGTFSMLVDRLWAGQLKDELRWLGDSLGRVRDLDVLRERLEASAEGSGSALIPFFNRLADEHGAAREELRAAMASSRYRDLLDRLIDAARLPILTEASDERASHLAPRLVAPVWQKLKKRARALDATSPEEDWHEVRIKAKRARYAAEAVLPALSGASLKGARRFATAAATVQETLGGLQDAAVAQEMISSCLKDAGNDPVLHFAAGRLYEKESMAAAHSRASFGKAWAKLDRRKSLLWLTNDDR